MTSITDWSLKAKTLSPINQAFVDGQYIDAHNGETFTRRSPVDGRDLPPVLKRISTMLLALLVTLSKMGDGKDWCRSNVKKYY